jgi:malonate transporter
MGLVETIIVVFGVIAIAYAAAHFKLLDERVGDGLSDSAAVQDHGDC